MSANTDDVTVDEELAQRYEDGIRARTEHADIGPAEHGARRGTLYARCSCGWSGGPRRSLVGVARDIAAHIERRDVYARTVAARRAEAVDRLGVTEKRARVLYPDDPFDGIAP